MRNAAVDRSLTLIAFPPDGLHKKRSNVDIFAELLQSLNAIDVSCIQFMPNGYVQITFTSLEARGAALINGIFLGPNRLHVFEAVKIVRTVFVHRLPFEVPDEQIRRAFEDFGYIHDLTEEKLPGSSIFTGTRILKMSVTSAIPVSFRVFRYPCRVFYHSQLRSCYIWDVPDHCAADYPLHDLCRHCRQPGHYARECTSDPAAVPVPPAGPADLTVPHVEPAALSESKPMSDVSSEVSVAKSPVVRYVPRRRRIKPVPTLNVKRSRPPVVPLPSKPEPAVGISIIQEPVAARNVARSFPSSASVVVVPPTSGISIIQERVTALSAARSSSRSAISIT